MTPPPPPPPPPVYPDEVEQEDEDEEEDDAEQAEDEDEEDVEEQDESSDFADAIPVPVPLLQTLRKRAAAKAKYAVAPMTKRGAAPKTAAKVKPKNGKPTRAEIAADDKIRKICKDNARLTQSQWSHRRWLESERLFKIYKLCGRFRRNIDGLCVNPACYFQSHSEGTYNMHCCERCWTDNDANEMGCSKKRAGQDVPHGRKCEGVSFFDQES